MATSAKGRKSPRYSAKTYSERPLPPGVGLTSIMIHMTNCRPKSRKWSSIIKKAKKRAFTTQYRAVHESAVAPKVFNQNFTGCFFNSLELSIISSPALFAPERHLRIKGKRNTCNNNHLNPLGFLNKAYEIKSTHKNFKL